MSEEDPVRVHGVYDGIYVPPGRLRKYEATANNWLRREAERVRRTRPPS